VLLYTWQRDGIETDAELSLLFIFEYDGFHRREVSHAQKIVGSSLKETVSNDL
jgi:hypothetical protein